MSRSTRRILILVVALPLLRWRWPCCTATRNLAENAPRDFWTSLQWAAETFTSTGYGSDSRWSHPAMVVFVILVQLLGVATVFLVFPFYLVPFFEDRFEGRLPARPPRRLHDYVLVYRWGSAVVELVESLRAIKRPVLVFEEDESVAKRIRDRGVPVVFGRIDEGSRPQRIMAKAPSSPTERTRERHHPLGGRALTVSSRGPVPGPMMAAGAGSTPTHILAALAARLAQAIVGVGAGLRAYDLRVADGGTQTVEEIERLSAREGRRCPGGPRGLEPTRLRPDP